MYALPKLGAKTPIQTAMVSAWRFGREGKKKNHMGYSTETVGKFWFHWSRGPQADGTTLRQAYTAPSWG